MLLQRVLEFPNRAVWAVGDGMRLVEDSSSVLSVCWKMGCHDAVDLEVPAYLENLVQDAKHRSRILLSDMSSMSSKMHADSLHSLTFIGSVCSESSSLILVGLILSMLSSDGRLEINKCDCP